MLWRGEDSEALRLNASANLERPAPSWPLGFIELVMSEQKVEATAEETKKQEEDIIKRHEELTERYTHLTSSEIVQRAVLIEKALENVIASHYLSPNYDQFLPFRSLIFRDGRIDFADKIKMVKKLLKNDYPLIYEQVSPLFNKLDKARDLRNRFAHSKILPPNYNEKELYMESEKDGKVVKELIDSDENKQLIYEATGCQYLLMKIEAEMGRHKAIGKKMPLPTNIMRFFRERWSTLLIEEKAQAAEATKAEPKPG